MKTFNEWLESHLKDNPEDLNLEDRELMDKFNAYIKTGLKQNDEPNEEQQMRKPLKGFDEWNKENQQPLKGFEQKTTESVGEKLDELNENLKFFKRYIVLITIALFVIMSWTALGATGSWWKWFAFFAS